MSFTATTTLPLLRQLVEKMTNITLGRGGLISFKESNWLMTIKFNYYPTYPSQPEDAVVWWGYGLNPDTEGNFVKKKGSSRILVGRFWVGFTILAGRM